MAKENCFRAEDLSLSMCKRKGERIRIVSVEKRGWTDKSGFCTLRLMLTLPSIKTKIHKWVSSLSL